MRLLTVIVVVCLTACGAVASAQEEAKPAAAPAPQASAPAATVDKSTTVYVSDFELDVVAGKDEKGVPIVTPVSMAKNDAKKDDGSADQASKLVDFLSASLVKELQKAGYTAARLRAGQTRPDEGIQIKGVFTEPDEDNHLRLAVMGSGINVGKMALFVGIGNLARPDQPLYTLVDLQGQANAQTKPGALINVSAYMPVAKFDVPKDATEKTVTDTAGTIVADLTTLLSANVASVSH